MNKRGYFITFESIDGLGKTTQLELLEKALRDAGYDIHRTKEPGDAEFGTCVSAGIRHLLFKDPTTKRMRPGVADCLFLADHIQNAGDVEDALCDGKIVLSDRYADSQFAYAATPGKACPAWALEAYRLNYGPVPDMTVFLRARGPLVASPGWTVGDGTPLGVPSVMEEDISWSLKRAKARTGAEAGKQEGKAWNDVHQQELVQAAYEEMLLGKERTLLVDVWEDSTIGDLHEGILQAVQYHLHTLGLWAPAGQEEKAG